MRYCSCPAMKSTAEKSVRSPFGVFVQSLFNHRLPFVLFRNFSELARNRLLLRAIPLALHVTGLAVRLGKDRADSSDRAGRVAHARLQTMCLESRCDQSACQGLVQIVPASPRNCGARSRLANLFRHGRARTLPVPAESRPQVCQMRCANDS